MELVVMPVSCQGSVQAQGGVRPREGAVQAQEDPAVHNASSGARLLGEQNHGLEQKVPVGEGVPDGVGAGGHGLVQAPPLAHLELQGGGHQEVLAGCPAWPWPNRPGCEGGGWSGLLPSTPW